MASIKYRNANDQNNINVCIDDVTEEYRKITRFYCKSCGMEMIAKIKNEGRVPHFAHKHKCDCNPKRYLHTLAEEKIQQRFYDDKRPFKIMLYHDVVCCNKCELVPEVCRTQGRPKENILDLKKYYQKCELEKRVASFDGNNYFVADLKLTSIDNPQRLPIMVEVYVTHENSEKKRNSGHRIIEVNISDKPEEGENDIENFCNLDIICDTEHDREYDYNDEYYFDNYDYSYNRDGSISPVRIRFDGFNPRPLFQQLDYNIPIYRVLFYKSNKFHFSQIHCKDLHNHSKEYEVPNLLYEFNIVPRQPGERLASHEIWWAAYSHLIEKNYNPLQTCKHCINQYYSNNKPFCRIYGAPGTYESPTDNMPKCVSFLPNDPLMELWERNIREKSIRFIEV